jgi:probable HAF family extracellular repeat protein
MQDLGDLGGGVSYARAMNDLGQVVGGTWNDDYSTRAFFWSPGGGMVDLGTLGGESSEAWAVNSRGQVVGWSSNPSGGVRAFLWTATGGIVDLGTLGGESSEARSINDQGQVVGLSTTASGDWHAFLWTENDGMKDLGTLDGNSSLATFINNRGQIIGQRGNDIIENGKVKPSHAILWSLPSPPSPSSSPEEQIKRLIAMIESLIRAGEIKKGIGKALIVELRWVLKKLEKDRNKTACWLLHSFTHQIKSLVKSRKLSSGNGEKLIQKAGEVGICVDVWKAKHKGCGKK